MQIRVYSIGKIKTPQISELVDQYYLKIRKQLPRAQIVQVKVADKAPDKPIEPLKFAAGHKLELPHTFWLAEWGQQYNILGFVAQLNEYYEDDIDLNFVVGNAWGWEVQKFDPKLAASGLRFLSLSQFTLNHELAQLVLWEQLYRFADFLRGGSYNK